MGHMYVINEGGITYDGTYYGVFVMTYRIVNLLKNNWICVKCVLAESGYKLDHNRAGLNTISGFFFYL